MRCRCRQSGVATSSGRATPDRDRAIAGMERVLERVRAMIGDRDAAGVEFDLHSNYSYTLAAVVAERLRDRRVLLVGDAVHHVPPFGGIGVNTGIQTAHNLA